MFLCPKVLVLEEEQEVLHENTSDWMAPEKLGNKYIFQWLSDSTEPCPCSPFPWGSHIKRVGVLVIGYSASKGPQWDLLEYWAETNMTGGNNVLLYKLLVSKGVKKKKHFKTHPQYRVKGALFRIPRACPSFITVVSPGRASTEPLQLVVRPVVYPSYNFSQRLIANCSQNQL